MPSDHEISTSASKTSARNPIGCCVYFYQFRSVTSILTDFAFWRSCVICPSRSRWSNNHLHTISFSCPLCCVQLQAWHILLDNARRESSGCAAMVSLIRIISAVVTIRPLYENIGDMESTISTIETQRTDILNG
jgi:hypothetical protein